MRKQKGLILENKKITQDHRLLRLRLPEMAGRCLPGQFLEVYLPETCDPLLPRPFSFFSADKTDVRILYRVLGKATTILSKKIRGEALEVLGPLGNGFELPKRTKGAPCRVVLVGGGVGIPPLHHFAAELLRKKRVTKEALQIYLGARSKRLLLCERDFKKLKVHVAVSTEDGSKGVKGLVTLALEDYLVREDPKSVSVFACGPVPMLGAVSALCRKYEVRCRVSMEVMMACGVGACLGCAVKVKTDKQTQPTYVMACKEGPVFDAEQIAWE